MKRKFRRLCNRHRWIPVAITILFIALWLLLLWKVGALAELERDEMISFYIAAGVMLLCSLVAGSACSSYLMNPTVKSLNNQCDPFPLLAECEDQFTYVKNKGNRQLLTINHAAALIELGRNEEALAELEALNIVDALPGTQEGYGFTEETPAAEPTPEPTPVPEATLPPAGA